MVNPAISNPNLTDKESVFGCIQACIRFCLEDESFPVFLEWLKNEYAHKPPSFFEPELLKDDMRAMNNFIATIAGIADV